MLENLNAKIGKKEHFKKTIGAESVHDINNDSGLRLINYAISKNMMV